jgi:hypothetical protein
MKSLYLYEIIGLPLKAIIDAETLAARASVDFIKDIGFTKNVDIADKKNINLGTIRVVHFNYNTIDETGKEIESTVTIPLLSLVPIPLLQIQEANLDFNIKITDVQEKTGDNKQIIEKKLLASYADGAKNQSYQINIKLKLTQSDLPAGISALFNILENNIKKENTDESE